jgi:hypothetical protein
MDDSGVKMSRYGRARGAVVLGALLTAVALAATGCGGKDQPKRAVASVGAQASGNSTASPAASGYGNPVAYAQCMRANGLPNFPDPEKDGAIKIDPRNGSLDPNSPEFKKAQEKCASLMGSGDKKNNSGDDLWPMDKKLNYAKCMRANGIPDFPDPDNTGQFPPFPKGGNIDPQSSQFKKADDACKQYKPGIAPGGGPGGAGGGPGGGGAGGAG